MTTPLWTLEQVSVPGTGSHARLKEISLQINAGTTALLGDSGAGKTTLLNLLVGFERPRTGRVTSHLPRTEDRIPLFWVPPQEGLWPHLKVHEHLDVVIPTGRSRESRTDELLRAFDLLDLRNAFPQTLSQGERGRLAVARALATEARVLILDEPLSAIGATQSALYWDVLRSECRDRDISLIMATHNPEVVLREAEQVVCLDRGTVAFAGSVQELYYSPPSREIARFLGPINWIPRDETLRWTGRRTERDLISRPEQIRIEPSAESPLVVQHTQFGGAVEEVRIDDLESHRTRRFFHRPVRPTLTSGMRVAIRVLTLFLYVTLSITLSGCLNASAHSRPLTAKSTRSWNLPAEKSSLPAPRGVHAASSGELYVLDNAGRILVYDQDRKFSRSWFMPEYSVGKPERLKLLHDGRIAVADTHYHRIVFFNPQGKVLSMIGKYGNGPGEFIYPVALDEDEAENLYVCEYGGNDRVQKFDKHGKFLLEFGKFGTGEGEFQRPSGIIWRDHTLFIVDAFNNRVQRYDDQGKYLGLLGGSDRQAELNYPYDLSMNPAGELFIVEYGGNCVTRLSPKGDLLGRFGQPGSNVEPFSTPWGITLDNSGRIYVADTGNRRVTELSP